MQIAGYSFENPTRHVYLHLYNPSANHDKVYHIVADKNSEGKVQVSVMWGRRGSSLRHMVKTKDRNQPAYLSEWSARAVFDKLLGEQIKGGYEVKNDETFTPGAPVVVNEIEIESEESTLIWPPRSYAENPVRATVVNHDFELAGYGIVLLPEGKRIITLIEKDKNKFFDQHGAEITVEQSLFNAVYDLEDNTIIDGVWDGDRYFVFDMPGESDYTDRIKSLAEYIDGTVDENVVQMADIYLTTAEAQMAVTDARERGAATILGILMSGGERPGQNDKSRVMLSLRPRAVLCVMKTGSAFATLGVDDGLGLIEVGSFLIPEDIKAGDSVLVEYDSWDGHGSELKKPVFIKKVDQGTDCSIEQLLAV
jgi:predicted DNA-binding WGR domain protein